MSGRPRVAVIGCGLWGTNHIRVWSQLGCLVAVCDSDAKRLATTSTLGPSVARHEDAGILMASPEVDVVVIASPPETHEVLAVGAMEAGKHVLVEKPMALTVASARRMAAVAASHNRLLMVGHVLEYHPAFTKLRQLVKEGALGRIQYIYSNRLNFGRVRATEDALWSFAPHDIAAILGIVGEKPLSVTCQGGAFLRPNHADSTVMHLEFGSVSAHIFVSWLHPFKEHRFVVVGDQQMAVLDDTAPWAEKLQLFPYEVGWPTDSVPVARCADRVTITVEQSEPLLLECEELVKCITLGTAPRTGPESGIAVLEVLEAGTRSMTQRGYSVALDTTTDVAPEVHPTAIVDPGAEVGKGTKIWHFSHIMDGARIGDDCVIGQNCFIGRDVRVGDGVRVQNNVSVYSGVTLERSVFCGPSVVFTNVRNPRSERSRRGIYEKTLVKEGASLGANAVIVCGITIGRYAMIGAGAAVTRDVPDYALVVGVPAKVAGWRCQCGEPIESDGGYGRCECGEEYVLSVTNGTATRSHTHMAGDLGNGRVQPMASAPTEGQP